MNMDDFMFLHQRNNGVSSSSSSSFNNGDHPQIPVIQRPQGYNHHHHQSSNWIESNQMLPIDIGLLTEESVHQMHLYLAQMQRNQIQSANWQVPQVDNNHGVVILEEESMQSLNPNPNEMKGHESFRLLNLISSPDRVSQSRESTLTTQMLGNQALNSQTWVSIPTQMLGNRALNSQTRVSMPIQMLGTRAQDSQTRVSMPVQMQGNRAQNSQSRESIPTQMQGNKAQNSQTRVSKPTQMQGNRAQNSQTPESIPTQMLGNRAQDSQTRVPMPTQMLGNRAQDSQTRVSMSTQMQGNRAQNSQTPVSLPTQMQGNQAQNSQTRVSKPTQMQGNQARNSQIRESKPTQIPGNRAQNSLTQASMATQMQMNQAQDSQTWESIPTQMQGNQAHNSDWTETIGLYTEILQDKSTRLLTNGVCLPQNTNSDLNNYNRDLALQNHQWQVENQAAGGQYLRVCSTPEANGSYSQLENDWTQQNCVDLNQWQQEFFSGLNQTITTSGLETNQSDGFHIPFQLPLHKMASPSNVEYVATSSTTIGFNNAPITPEKDNWSRLNQVSATDNSYAIQRWSPEKDKQDMVVPSIKEHDGTYSNQVLTGVIASPSNSTTSIKEKVPEEGTDLNKTPQQKTPKRKKHRPKVVKEGKPKRPPKPVVSKTEVDGEKSTGKRKYVRRKGLETSTPPQNNDENEVDGSKSCRRELKFDSEPKKPEEKDKTSYLHGSKIVSNSHETTPSTELNIVSVVPAPKKDLQSINSWNLISAANQRIANEVPKRDRKAQLNSPKSDHVVPRNIEIQNASSYQENHVYSEAEQMSFLELAWATHNTEAQQLPQKGTDHVNDFQEIKEKTGQKRDYVNISGQKSSKTGSVSEISNLGVYKKTRLDESPTQSLPSVTAYGKHEHWQVFCRNMLDCSKEIEVYENINSLENIVTENQFRNDIAVENNIQQKSRSLVEEIMHRNKMMRDSFQQKKETTVKNSMIISRSDAATKSHNTVKEVANEKALPRDYKEIACQHPTRKARGISTKHSSKHVKRKKKEKVVTNPIDEIIHRLGLLGINDEQGALVPYVGHGTLVPFEPIKKRKPRPRVNLDFETITQWNLLMGKAENEAAEKCQDKEKWWEAEREVFRGRVDKFIARMHLVQGDRRFSRWKGSVVDSVIGVFLTQNVSDHLSSSAFMSLAARFPLRSTATAEGASFRTSISAWVEEPEVQVIDPDGTITFPWGSIRQPLYNQDSTEIGVHLVENNNGSPKDVVSSQNSSDSIILQASEDIRNGSDSEVEYQNQNRKTGKADTFTQDPTITMNPFLGFTGLIDLNVLLSEESFDPATSINPVNTISDTRATESYFSIPKVNQSMSYFNPSESEATKIQGVFPVGMSAAESITVGLTGSTKETGSSTDRYSAANQNQTLNGFNYETSTAVEAHRPNEAHSEQKTGILYPTGENIGSEGTKTSNERRTKNDTNKMKEVDWDELRKQVLGEGAKKERGTDKLDSMDYEDLGNADVSKISDAIRERGMNNMLAERIKAFLNRLVKDHGSIDLEWLRDVPPDKAKDYLLSIRGLGLKSVECIRLLSLHHMAFPVDTNVGRIAVRLGWVPLQPLPESLQLHLLEMYPILESIQKYIWPRLCKLDQRTLYELHYQMITFGKVFCTKSRPNCNVCPMKGECRHFASAFASARLALPGPEEKGIVSCSNNPVVAPSEDLPIIMDPLLLAFGESSLNGGLMHFTGECEPIIEEPTTPEIYREDTESDIEDVLPQDPNEIPVIEFSLEALKANVQNIIQEQNIEISEGDLSKALVALNPATASIPAPKLKNISRLRTEHHVYELPDWHPLLEGLDRREPDDPSPYLLAIWTPGETADSIQPFENSCSLRGSGRLCDEKTCFQCNSIREAEAQMVRGTILVPCRTAMRGSFPLNGTYFQVNEVFADHESSMYPIAVPRDLLWNLRRRTVYFGTSVTSIFRGMPIEEIQYCFWRGFVCVRGFDRKFRAPRPLMARLHFTASRLAKNKKEGK